MEELFPKIVEDKDLNTFLTKLKKELIDIEVGGVEIKDLHYSRTPEIYSVLIIVSI